MQFALKYRGKPLILTPALPDDATVGDLRQRVAEVVGSDVVKTRLLVTGGKALLPGDDDSLLNTKLPSSSSSSSSSSASASAQTATILVLATATSGHAKLAETVTSPLLKHHRIHDDTDIPSSSSSGNTQQQRTYKYVGVPSTTSLSINGISSNGGNNYGFDIVEALPDYTDSDAAHRVLQRLATDTGILTVMRARRWRVGALREMRPQGRVGVDPCLMGYNRNRGEEIRLRLRTDDNKGFRQLEQLMHVLAHELAHNEHDGHGVEFKEMMRWIERTAAEHPDWRGEGGRSLTNGAEMAAVPMRSFAGGSGSRNGSRENVQIQRETVAQPLMVRGGRRGVVGSANSRRSRLLEQAQRVQRERRQANKEEGQISNGDDDELEKQVE